MMITIKGIKQAYRPGVHNELIIAKIVQYVKNVKPSSESPLDLDSMKYGLDRFKLFGSIIAHCFQEELMQQTGRLSISS